MSDSRNADRTARLALADDDQTSAAILTRLAIDEDAEVRRAVASNPNTPQDVLLKLGKEFPNAIVANPIFNILLLENPESLFVRLCLARSSASNETLANLSALPDEEILCAIAENPNTPVTTLEQLVQSPPQIYDYDDPDGSEFDRLFTCVAKNPNTPASLLIELAEDSSFAVLSAIARNPNTPADILYRFAGWRNHEIHRAILQKIGVPATVLEQLAGEESWEIRSLVKAHPNASERAIALAEFMEEKPGTPIHFLEMFATDSRPSVRRLVADHPNTPSHVLEALTLDEDEDVLLKVLEHPNASASTLERIAEWLLVRHQQSPHRYSIYEKRAVTLIESASITDRVLETLLGMKSYMVMSAIAKLTTVSPSILLKLTEFEGSFQQVHFWRDLCRNPNTPAEALEVLFSRLYQVKHPDVLGYLYQIGQHPNTPVRLLEQLAIMRTDCPPLNLREAVCKNPNLPEDLLRQWASDPTLSTWIAENPNTPADLLSRFATSPDVSIRRGVAGNSNTPVAILEILADDEDLLIRTRLLTNPSTPVDILECLATDRPDVELCTSLLKNPKTPAKLLALLVDAQNENVRYEVATHPNTSPESVVKLAADASSRVRKGVLQRSDLTEVVLETLVKTAFAQVEAKGDIDDDDIDDDDSDPDEGGILEAIGKHPKTPIHILEMLATHHLETLYDRFDFWFLTIRKAVASNINTPIAILEQLVGDYRPESISVVEEIPEDYQPEVVAAARKTLKAKF